MKTIVTVFLFLFLIFSMSADEIPEVDLTKIDNIFNVGIFNNKPENVNYKLEKDEFKILTVASETIQVKQPDQFPQQLKANQRIALFLGQIDSKTDLQVETKILSSRKAKYPSPILELCYNGNVFYRSHIWSQGDKMRFFIPKTWHEEGVNVLEIRNSGTSVIAFDAFVVKKYSPCNNSIKTSESNKEISTKLPSRIKGIAASAKRIAESGHRLRDKSVRFLPNDIIKYLMAGGELFSFRKFSALKDFYDPYTGKPILAYYAIAAGAPLLEDSPQKTIADVFPTAQEEILYGTLWFAVKNNEHTMTVAIATTPDDRGKCVDALFPVPWNGESELEITSGFLPECIKRQSFWLSNQSTEKKKITVSDNFIKVDLNIIDFTILRLIKSDKDKPESIKLVNEIKKWKKPVFKRGILKTSLEPPLPTDIRIPLLDITEKSTGATDPSESYKTEIIPATKAKIGKIKDVTPWDGKSIKIEIAYPDGKPFDEEWAGIRFNNNIPKGCEYISFWVYPRSENPKIKRVNLLMYFEPKRDKYKFLATALKTDIWQKVIVPINKSGISDRFRIVGDPMLHEYKKGNKISFEFNGLAAIDTENKTGLKTVRSFSGTETYTPPASETDNQPSAKTVLRKSKTIVLTGNPESYFEYRYAFKEPAEFKTASNISKVKGLKIIWHQDAQVLEIKGNFPGKNHQVPEKILRILTAQEKKSLQASENIPIAIKLTYE
jgi:hypothetical protein